MDLATCADSMNGNAMLQSVEKVTKDLNFNGVAVGTVTVEVQPTVQPSPLCVRMEFEAADSFSLVSIRGGIFTQDGLIPEPVEYRNRKNAAKVVSRRGLPTGTLLTKLSLVICQDEIVADDMGCCPTSLLYWVGHAILKGGDGEEFRAEIAVDETCERRVADGPNIPVCELTASCGCDSGSCFLETADGRICVSNEDFLSIGTCLGDAVVADPTTQVCKCGCPAGEEKCLKGGNCVKIADFQENEQNCPSTGVTRKGLCACILKGTPGTDIIFGGPRPDLIYGYDGDDLLYGGGGDNEIFGGNGADRITGGPGDDFLEGGSGQDNINGSLGDDYINGGDDDDSIHGSDGDDIIFGASGADDILGGAGNDYINGGGENDTIYGQGGDDHIFGEEDNDILKGGNGDDHISGGSGDDHINGDNGNDYASGGNGNDKIRGNAGDDDLNGGGGEDRLYGGDGNDKISGGDGDDYANGGEGDDIIDSES
eukprot:CAMPEP_0184748734 /NCGR_PEP_ID=MMETSP0315-20130426/22219_1 /TAXON_ID=101924 /ORGANISM="Rhodosorus marinus, Strain UTEX LB 2760" /LENGTH=482 /DNA_ID=CAMNT_0027224557 /DNA_START=254 /DNA_END=1702 /DNA_ORIENTATION=+